MSKRQFIDLMWEHGLFGYDIEYNINNFIGDIIDLYRGVDNLPITADRKKEVFEDLREDKIEKFFDELTNRLYEGIYGEEEE